MPPVLGPFQEGHRVSLALASAAHVTQQLSGASVLGTDPVCRADASSASRCHLPVWCEFDAHPLYCSRSFVIFRVTLFFYCADEENIPVSLFRTGIHLCPEQTVPIAAE